MFQPLRSFFVRCNGPANRFKIPGVAESQNANSGVTAGAAAVGSSSMTISGAASALTEGQLVTVNEQLLALVADQTGSTITFEPPLRAAVALGAAVETSQPWAVVKMAGDIGWQVELGPIFTASFSVEEAF